MLERSLQPRIKVVQIVCDARSIVAAAEKQLESISFQLPLPCRFHPLKELANQGQVRDLLVEGTHLYFDYLPLIVEDMQGKRFKGPKEVVHEAWVMRYSTPSGDDSNARSVSLA